MDEKTMKETFRTVMQSTDEDEVRASFVALQALGAVTGASPAVVQRMLDSDPGVVLARAVADLVDAGDLTLRQAVEEAVRRQAAWSFGHDAAKAHGVDPRAPYFAGWAQVAGRELPPEQTDDPREDRISDDVLPPGVLQAFERSKGFGFVSILWPVVGKTEAVALCLAAALAIATEAEAQPEAIDALLRDRSTGRAFALNVLVHLELDPERQSAPALVAAVKDWLQLSLPPAAAARFGAEPGTARLIALTDWHERNEGRKAQQG